MGTTNDQAVKQELVPTAPPSQGTVIVQAASPEAALFDPTGGRMAFWCNWPINDDAGQALAMAALNGADQRLADCINLPLSIVHAFVQPVSLINEESGEVAECPRVVLIDANGVSYGCVSGGIFNSLKAIIAMKGKGPWNPPLNVRMRQVNTRASRRTFVLDLVLGHAAATAKKGGKGNGP